MQFLIVIVLLFAVMWFVLIRPQRRRKNEQTYMLATLKVGDEIVTAGGLFGEVRTMDEDELTLEIAPDVVVRVARRAVAGNLTAEREANEEDDGDEEPEEPAEEEQEASEPKSTEANPR